VEVLAERVTPRKPGRVPAEDADEPADASLGVPSLYGAAGEGSVALAGRTRHNKLVHFSGDPGLVGCLVNVRIDYAGPFALRGRVA
jgi:hypothetical protein